MTETQILLQRKKYIVQVKFEGEYYSLCINNTEIFRYPVLQNINEQNKQFVLWLQNKDIYFIHLPIEIKK